MSALEIESDQGVVNSMAVVQGHLYTFNVRDVQKTFAFHTGPK
jgi:hypothetical protein